MNTTSLAKSMNGVLSVTDGEITMENGDITFSDGSVLSSIGDIALKSADNVMTGDNTFNNNITMGAEIPTSTFHLTNKSYVDDSIAQETLSILAGNNTFTGINTFSNKLIATDISNTGLINDLTIGRWGDELGSIIFGETTAKKTGIFNTIIGTNTFINNTTGSLNTTLGHSVLRLNTTGEANTATGDLSLYSNTTGSNNTGDGFGALFSNTIGGKNSAIGYYSGTNQKTGNNNTFLGSNTQVASLTQTYNNSTAIGYNSSIDASNQIVMGTANEYVKIPSTKVSSNSTTGALVVSGGVGIAGNVNVGGALNVGGSLFSSYNAGGASITYPSTGYALNWNITGGGAETSLINVVPNTTYFDRGFNFHNVVQGVAFTGSSVPMFSLNAITSTLRSNLNVSGELTTDKSINNVRIKGATILGKQTIVIDTSANSISNLLTSGQENYVFGKSNLINYTTGTHNVSIGLENLQAITTQSYNTAIGCNVLKLATSNFNVGIGEQVLKLTTTGGYNVGIGYNSLTENITGTNNIGIGYWSGRYNTGSYNTFIGDQTKTDNLAGYNNSTAIGSGATITASNQVVLGFAGVSYFTVIPSTKASTSSTTGALVVGGGVGVEGQVSSNTGFAVDYAIYPGNFTNGLFRGSGDGNTATTYNLAIKSWFGVGFVNSNMVSNPTQTASLYMDVRDGTFTNNFTVINQTLSVAGTSYLNGNVSIKGNTSYITNDTNLRWTGGEKRFKVESYWGDNDRYGLSYTHAGQVRLHISNTYDAGSISFGRATGDSTYMDLVKISYNGDTIVASLTDSTNTSTGAFKVSGGAAVSKSLSVGKNLTVGDNFTMSSGIINVISTGLGEVGSIIANFVDFYTFPDKGVYIFYINRCNANGVGVLSSEALDANTSKTLMITMGTIGMVIFNMGSTNGYINIVQGTTDRKLTAQIGTTGFNYTYWWHRLF